MPCSYPDGFSAALPSYLAFGVDVYIGSALVKRRKQSGDRDTIIFLLADVDIGYLSFSATVEFDPESVKCLHKMLDRSSSEMRLWQCCVLAKTCVATISNFAVPRLPEKRSNPVGFARDIFGQMRGQGLHLVGGRETLRTCSRSF